MKKVLIFMSICTLLLNTSCKKEVEKKEENTHFLVTNPIKKDTLITKDYVSQIQSSRHIELRAQERGYLQKIFIDDGRLM